MRLYIGIIGLCATIVRSLADRENLMHPGGSGTRRLNCVQEFEVALVGEVLTYRCFDIIVSYDQKMKGLEKL